jgi:aminoglycoside phosphotransferase (APT) family kinase protein
VKRVQGDEAHVTAGLQRLAGAIATGNGRVEGVRRLVGGASQQTWAFDVRGDGGSVPLILRRAADGAGERARMTAGPEVEAHLMAAAKAAGVPVPGIRHVLRPEDELGRGFVMERLQGETLGGRIVRDARFAAARRVLARQCGEALARIHSMSTADLPPLRRGGASAEQQFQLDLHRSHRTVRPVFELAFQWLRRHSPSDVKPVLVHGDFRNGNLMVDESGLVGVLCVNAWRFGALDLPVGGFGTRDDLFEGYAAAGGHVDVQRVHYWEVFGTLKWGVICESMAHAWLAGYERDVEKAAIGRRASESEIDLLALLAPR